ncbi:choice-of-anchor D domain-containing protein [Myxococcota bacterium]|nr:choice-of-anchor D domain-containing protein [Myxococcota bacterium]
MNRFLPVVSKFSMAILVFGAVFFSACGDDENFGENLNLDYSPGTINFGSVPVGGQKTITVTLTHIGDSGKVIIDSVTTQGLNSDYQAQMPTVAVLEPGDSTTVDVTYVPTDSNTDSGYLVIGHNIATLEYKTLIAVTSAGQTAAIITEPSPIDFGDVPVGESATMDVVVKNIGTASFLIEQIYMDPEGPASFNTIAIVPPEGETLPVELGPNETIGLTIQFNPLEGKPEESLLYVTGEGNTWSFEVFGTGLGPKIDVNPAQLEMGGVNIGASGRALCVVTNVGNDTLRISNTTIAPGSDEGLSVEGDLDYNLAPGASRDVYVNWAVTEAKKSSGSAIGWLSITSNDAASPTVVPIYGRINTPILTVVPDPLVDMGYGAQGVTVYRSVTVRNDGSANLVISGEPTLFDISEQKYGAEFRVDVIGATMSGGNYTLPAGTGMEVRLSFTNKGPATGSLTAKLKIISNDKSVPNTEKVLNITVKRAGTATCIPVIEPNLYNFGMVPMGFTKELPVRVVNKGMGYCSYKGAQVQDCSGGFGGMTGACSEPFTTTRSSKFLVVSQPPVVKDGMAPAGGTLSLRIKFAPPQTGSIFGDMTEYSALLGLMFRDTQLGKDLVIPESGTSGWAANLKGSSGVANLAVLPSDIKFGLVTLGCASKTYQVCAYNTGSAPLQVTKVNLDGCTPEFRLKNVPGLPRAISTGSPLCFDVLFVPQDTTEDSCILKVESNEKSVPELFVGLSGQGTIYSDQTDTFTQLSGQEVDILFVIDDSGSMCGEQDTLIANFEQFIQHADVWDNDYHIGVVSTGLSYDHLIGKLNFGNIRTTPRYITPGPNAKSQFADLANLGCDGDNSEGALQNAQGALSAPLITDTGVSCSNDDSCKSDPNICADSASCPFLCLDSTCGGFNKGFLRPDAQLEIIAMSDEEDQSSGDLGFYIDFLRSLKGFYNQNMMHFNAIVGVDDGTLTDEAGNPYPGCLGTEGSGAAEGKRYIETVHATNGKLGSICDPNYKDILNQIGSVAFGLKQQFFLSRIADPNSITVKVREIDVTEGWEYDAPSNSIVFDPESPNMPQEGDKIVVHYETLCFEP